MANIRVENFRGPTDSIELPVSTNGSMSRLEYPSNFAAESGNFIMLNRMKYKKPSFDADAIVENAEGASTVVLPLPPTLQTSYTANWENQNLGIGGNQLSGLGGAAGAAAEQTLQGNSDWRSFMELANAAKNGAGGFILNNFLDAATNNGVFEKAGLSFGVARNPYQAAVFQSTNFRSFNFSWKFFPRNEAESDTIKNIYRELKVGMFPDFYASSATNVLFSYPDMWKISFGDDLDLFKIHHCVLRDVTINYHGESTPVYFKGTKKRPASMTLETSFQEIKILTREDLENGY